MPEHQQSNQSTHQQFPLHATLHAGRSELLTLTQVDDVGRTHTITLAPNQLLGLCGWLLDVMQGMGVDLDKDVSVDLCTRTGTDPDAVAAAGGAT